VIVAVVVAAPTIEKSPTFAPMSRTSPALRNEIAARNAAIVSGS